MQYKEHAQTLHYDTRLFLAGGTLTQEHEESALDFHPFGAFERFSAFNWRLLLWTGDRHFERATATSISNWCLAMG